MVQEKSLDKLIIIVGPTASGKSGFAIKLAKHLNGEIVSADSMQIYRGLDVGTAKVTADEKDGIIHHMIDIINPDNEFSVAEYSKIAKKSISDIISRGRRAIVVGGTGLYIDSIIYDMSYGRVNKSHGLRERLYHEASQYGNEYLYNKLSELDPKASTEIHPNNTKRVIRAIEIALMGDKIKSKILDRKQAYPHIMLGLRLDRDILYERINLRVDEMLEMGLVEEVKGLYDKYPSDIQAFSAIGYKEIIEHLNNHISYDEAKDKIKKNTRNYAKRQLTWLKRYPDIYWLNPLDDINIAIQYIEDNL